MNKVRLVTKDLSQLDPGGALKSAHDDRKQAFRNVDVKDYDSFNATYDTNGNIVKIVYYQDQEYSVFSLGFSADVNSNYNNTYFLFNGPKDEEQYYIWFSVNNTGTDPSVPNRTGIRIDIQENDLGAIIAMAVQSTMSLFFKDEYTFTRTNSVVESKSLVRGITSEPSNNNVPGILITTIIEGTQTKLRTIYLDYDSNNCLTNYNSVEKNVKC